MLLLQDRREAFHPFNTARIVNKGLANSELVIERVEDFPDCELPLAERPALLFPNKNSTLISDLKPDQMPDQLIVVDGTWYQAKQVIRALPQLERLPTLQLVPKEPGQFRIRKEPNATALSTIEATVAALRMLEPETVGLDKLLKVFKVMVDRQLAHPGSAEAYQRELARPEFASNLPAKLRTSPENIIVAYGESVGRKPHPRKPVYWVAQRLNSDQKFVATIENEDMRLSEEQLEHFELSKEHFENALSISEFEEAWRSFVREDDLLLVFNYSTARLLDTIGAGLIPAIALKSIRIKEDVRNGNLANVVDFLNLSYQGVVPGRAGRRLAATLAIAEHLHHLGNFSAKKNNR